MGVKIGNIDIGEFPLLLAPMEDVSDPPFRALCKEHGADVLYTEFISSEGLIRDAEKSTMKLDRGTTDYLRAMSFDVVVEVVYRRTRRIRARNKLEAKEMARDRELNVASKRYDKMNKIAYEVKNVSAIKATPSGEKAND